MQIIKLTETVFYSFDCGNSTYELEGCITLNEHNTVFAWSKRSALCNRCFPGPTRVVDANGISIASAVFEWLTRWQTDWQTDRPRYSVGNNRRSAQWRSLILLLSTATTSIYWSSRLDRSDQLQQSAAIFNCKTRRVAVYVETHYNIASKRAFPIGVLDRWHNCLLIYWRTSCLVSAFDHSVTCLRLSDLQVK